MTTVLITGIAGSLARLTAMELVRRGDEVVGVDYRDKPDSFPSGVIFYRAKYNKSRIADVFRRHRPQVVLHLGRIANLGVNQAKRFDLNVLGSAKIMEMALQHGAERMIVLSTYHIYGAHPHNHVPILEDEPVRALQTVPQLSDSIQIDSQAVTWTFRHRKLRTVVLRPVNVVGPHINNTVCRYLRLPRIPYIIGFNPMWQFIHETDMIRALLCAADTEGTWGAFNVAGVGAMPIVDALKLAGRPLLPVPVRGVALLRRFSAAARHAMPDYLIDFLKYPVVVDDDAFRERFDFTPRVGAEEAVRSAITRMPVEPVLA